MASSLCNEDYWTELAATVTRQAGSLHVDSVRTKLADLRERIRVRHPFVDRISFALFEPGEGTVKGVLASRGDGVVPVATARPLSELPLFERVARSRRPVVADASVPLAADADDPHLASLAAEGFLASLCIPIEQDSRLLGFLLLDSRSADAFPGGVVDDLMLLAHLLGIIVRQELSSVEMLVGSLRLARQFAHLRDIETGSHLDRISSYAHVIAREVATKAGRGEDFVELLRLFAPLHDIGKVGVPDGILHKPGSLTPEERAIMNSHVPLGVQMADRLVRDFDLQGLESVALMRNVIAHHHELMDGTGYPGHLTGTQIPLESRIVAIADVLDALSCKRCYKPAWTIGRAIQEVGNMAGNKLDPDCIEALFRCRDEIEHIHQAFHEAA
ncbi:MAG: HD domain-containing protein [Rhodocyclaceae bacterium]|nr:HD domain-containing protein [Rhodocyclaceae bacterium]